MVCSSKVPYTVQLIYPSTMPSIHIRSGPRWITHYSCSPIKTRVATIHRLIIPGRNSSFKCTCSSSESFKSSHSTPLMSGGGVLNLPFSLCIDVEQLTPLRICKWSAIASLSVALAKGIINTLLNPFFWMYFSWTWIFWPWILAISLAIYGLYCLRKYSEQNATIFEQSVIVTSAVMWLTLVPPALFNGFLEGWPIIFFFAYQCFFFFLNIFIRLRLYGDIYFPERLYGDIYHRERDRKRFIQPSDSLRVLFFMGVFIGHWLAAAEAPELHLVPGGWSDVAIWGVTAMAVFVQYHASFYLAKYSEQSVVPTELVNFGPYRWVRHPVYASTMLMFAAYCAALRAPLSLLFLGAICLAYYEQRAKLEERFMLETFGERYKVYAAKVKYKFLPLVF